jgi:hypothetical protein
MPKRVFNHNLADGGDESDMAEVIGAVNTLGNAKYSITDPVGGSVLLGTNGDHPNQWASVGGPGPSTGWPTPGGSGRLARSPMR